MPGELDGLLNKLIVQARSDEPVYISSLATLLARHPDTVRITARVTASGVSASPEFSLTVPRPEELGPEALELVREYLCARVYNILSTFGGRTLTFAHDPSVPGLSQLLAELPGLFDVSETKMNRHGYGRCLNVAERLADAMDGLPPGSTTFQFVNADLAPEPLSSLKPVASPAARDTPSPETARPADPLVDSLRRIPERLSGKAILGMDVGGSDIKVVLALDGRIEAYKEYDWFPANFRRTRQLIEPVILIARWARARAAVCGDPQRAGLRERLDSVAEAHASDDQISAAVAEVETALGGNLPGLDAIGLCFPDVVVRNKIVGGEVYKTRGIRNNPEIDYEKDFALLTDLDRALAEHCRPGGTVRIINDGPMAAFTAAVERAFGEDSTVNQGVFAHTLGTELGTGWIDATGHLPDIPLEVYNYVIDLGNWNERTFNSDDPRSVNNFNTGIPGTLQKCVSQSGVFRLALKYFPERRPDLYRELFERGFLVTEPGGAITIPSEPRDMRKPLLEHLMALPERENDQTCQDIFRDVGECLAVAFQQTRNILDPGTNVRVLFGRLVKNAECFRLMCEGGARVAPEMQLVVADEDLAFTPLMQQLRDDGHYTVAQFAQAVGAVHFTVSE